jgi:inosine/xanthosine triphosphate pyrophosphatase family protein
VKVLIRTRNPHKLAEIRRILGEIPGIERAFANCKRGSGHVSGQVLKRAGRRHQPVNSSCVN